MSDLEPERNKITAISVIENLSVSMFCSNYFIIIDLAYKVST